MTVEVTEGLVRRLVESQFPQWRNLPIRPVAQSGWDNRTFHLGEEMLVRLPSAGRYAAAVEREHVWLPRLAPHLPLSIPAPLALGAPGEGYPYPWSVRGWLAGETALAAPPSDLMSFAADLAAFLNAFHAISAEGGPAAGKDSFFRGASLATYDAQTREAVGKLAGQIDSSAVLLLWDAALSAPFTGPPVWVHGDLVDANILVRSDRLSAVIDFGQLCVGDPACDLAIAWTVFQGESRRAFRHALPLDAGTWARGRGWALWKAVIRLAGWPGPMREIEAAPRVLAEILADRNQ